MVQKPDVKSLELMAVLSEDPKIMAEMQKARLVSLQVEDTCVRVWTDEGREWEVRRSAKDDAVYCTCPAWRFRKRSGQDTCKHCLAVQATGVEIPVFKGKKRQVFGVSLDPEG